MSQRNSAHPTPSPQKPLPEQAQPCTLYVCIWEGGGVNRVLRLAPKEPIHGTATTRADDTAAAVAQAPKISLPFTHAPPSTFSHPQSTYIPPPLALVSQ